jgi:poly-gamma-glutamate capsule biosynthesis protein CapA/YwtB (metallophosphatase superfamily)
MFRSLPAGGHDFVAGNAHERSNKKAQQWRSRFETTLVLLANDAAMVNFAGTPAEALEEIASAWCTPESGGDDGRPKRKSRRVYFGNTTSKYKKGY